MEQSLKEKLTKMGELSKKAKKDFVKLSTKDKNKILENIKISMEKNRENILEANKKDHPHGWPDFIFKLKKKKSFKYFLQLILYHICLCLSVSSLTFRYESAQITAKLFRAFV